MFILVNLNIQIKNKKTNIISINIIKQQLIHSYSKLLYRHHIKTIK